MKLHSIQSLREDIRENLEACRQKTLELSQAIPQKAFCPQAHPDFSPIGWHLGHIAFTEAYWILEYLGGLPPLLPQYKQLFAADGLPKSQRQYLPSPEFITDYLNTVRQEVLTYLETAPLEKQERLWRWLIQHESQHSETINLILQLLGHKITRKTNLPPQIQQPTPAMAKIKAGEFLMGNNKIEAQDNEKVAQIVNLDTYEIDQYPVTCQQYQQFIDAGGYQNSQWWSEEGWQWLQSNGVTQPLYWNNPQANHPVYGVSWYEAQAYACFVGKRLPTEAEWEKAASWDNSAGRKFDYPWGETPPTEETCNYNLNIGQTTPVNHYTQGKSPYGCYDMLGNVWEWTASWFESYQGFESYPYVGYSQAYFDGRHRVLKGGSWASRPWVLRTSFRNWYYPQVRQIFAGFRCAR